MTQPADAPPSADTAQPPSSAEGPRVRAVSDRRSSLERAHDALEDVLAHLGEDGTALLRLEGDAREKANVRIAQALRYARAHLERHMDEKSRSESLAVGIIGGVLAGLGGLVTGHVLTKPEETVRRGWLRDLLSSLSPEHKAAGLSALRQVAAVVDLWARQQTLTPEQERAEVAQRAQERAGATQEPGAGETPPEPPPTEAPPAP